MTILSKQFPMDLGTGSIEQVRQSAPKIDMELGAIYGHLNNIRTRYRSATAPSNPEAGQQWEDTVNAVVKKWNGSAWVEDITKSVNLTNRNTVLQGEVSSVGALELILGSAVALTADLVSSAIETIITIPAGHDDVMGNSDYIVSFTATQTDFWTSLPATNTSYLFVDYASGTVTGTYSVIAPVYQSYAPSHSAGKNWYDTNKEQWYVSDGSNWVAKYRCYVGSVVTDGSKVTATTIEPYNVIRSAVPASYIDTDGALAANSDIKIPTQKAVKTYVDANAGGGASIGTGNYIAEPFAVTPGTGLEVSVAANRCVIDETVCESTTATTVALTAKAAQLIYKKKDNTYDKLLPAMSAADLVDANTVGLWITDGSANVPNAAVGVNGNTLAVANDLIRSGTVATVDGWAGGDAAKGDGSTGSYVSANSTGFPVGKLRVINICFTHYETAGNRYLAFYGTGTSYCGVICNGSVLGILTNAGTFSSTNYTLQEGQVYLISYQVDADGAFSVFVDGELIISGTGIAAMTNTVLTVFGSIATNRSASAIHFVELRNALRTPAQIATLAQKLLIPCQYSATDIRDALANKAESQIVAFVRTSATAPTLIIDSSDPKGPTPDWPYGIRVGPNGVLNKVKRLGRKSFSGTSTPEWDNPFGSRNMTIDAEWSLDAAGTNSSPIPNDAATSYPSLTINNKIRETITTGVIVAGSQKTIGYIDIIAEVID